MVEESPGARLVRAAAELAPTGNIVEVFDLTDFQLWCAKTQRLPETAMIATAPVLPLPLIGQSVMRRPRRPALRRLTG